MFLVYRNGALQQEGTDYSWEPLDRNRDAKGYLKQLNYPDGLFHADIIAIHATMDDVCTWYKVEAAQSVVDALAKELDKEDALKRKRLRYGEYVLEACGEQV